MLIAPIRREERRDRTEERVREESRRDLDRDSRSRKYVSGENMHGRGDDRRREESKGT